jgi:hypothetical protein
MKASVGYTLNEIMHGFKARKFKELKFAATKWSYVGNL